MADNHHDICNYSNLDSHDYSKINSIIHNCDDSDIQKKVLQIGYLSIITEPVRPVLPASARDEKN